MSLIALMGKAVAEVTSDSAQSPDLLPPPPPIETPKDSIPATPPDDELPEARKVLPSKLQVQGSMFGGGGDSSSSSDEENDDDEGAHRKLNHAVASSSEEEIEYGNASAAQRHKPQPEPLAQPAMASSAAEERTLHTSTSAIQTEASAKPTDHFGIAYTPLADPRQKQATSSSWQTNGALSADEQEAMRLEEAALEAELREAEAALERRRVAAQLERNQTTSSFTTTAAQIITNGRTSASAVTDEDEFGLEERNASAEGSIGQASSSQGGVGVSALLAAQQQHHREGKEGEEDRDAQLLASASLPCVLPATSTDEDSGDASLDSPIELGTSASSIQQLIASSMDGAEQAAWQELCERQRKEATRVKGDSEEVSEMGSAESGIYERDGTGQMVTAHNSSLATRITPLNALTIAEDDTSDSSTEDSEIGNSEKDHTCDVGSNTDRIINSSVISDGNVDRSTEAHADIEPATSVTESDVSHSSASVEPDSEHNQSEASTWTVPVAYTSALVALQEIKFDADARAKIVPTAFSKGSARLFGGPPRLRFPGSKEQRDFVFLLAMVHWDPDNPLHLGMLQTCYFRLLAIADATPESRSQQCPPRGDHWNLVGFQGSDPCTDLNRSMGLLAVLQVLHLCQREPSRNSSGLNLGTELCAATAAADRFGTNTFFCLCIGFTLSAVQALRRGALYPHAIARSNVFVALHDLHAAQCQDLLTRLQQQQPSSTDEPSSASSSGTSNSVDIWVHTNEMRTILADADGTAMCAYLKWHL